MRSWAAELGVLGELEAGLAGAFKPKQT
jgi:hypothetical protein